MCIKSKKSSNVSSRIWSANGKGLSNKWLVGFISYFLTFNLVIRLKLKLVDFLDRSAGGGGHSVTWPSQATSHHSCKMQSIYRLIQNRANSIRNIDSTLLLLMVNSRIRMWEVMGNKTFSYHLLCLPRFRSSIFYCSNRY